MNLLTKNYKLINAIEENLKFLSFLLPGKFKNSQLISELLYATVKSLQVISRRYLLMKMPYAASMKNCRSKTDALTEIYERKSRTYKIAAYILMLLKNFQSAIEMTSKKQSTIFIIEILKAILKLILLCTSKNFVFENPISENELNEFSEFQKGKLSGKFLNTVSCKNNF